MWKTIQITIGEKLLAQLDQALKGRPRSAFIRESISAELKRRKIEELEKRHREGYLKYRVQLGEFSVDPRQLPWDEWEPKKPWRGAK